jgi:hypothetical protein
MLERVPRPITNHSKEKCFVLENQAVSQQEVAGLVGSTVRDIMNKPYGSQRAKVSVSQSLLRIAEGYDSDATRFRRGIGKSLVTTLLNAATLGAVANGTSDTDGIGDGRTCGFGDLHALLESVDPEYLASPKARWLMSFKNLPNALGR